MITKTFARDKETANTIRFREVPDGDPAIRELYVLKSALAKLGNPDKLALVVGTPEEFSS